MSSPKQILNAYKPTWSHFQVVGQRSIPDDKYLSGVSTFGAAFNTISRIAWGPVGDKFSYKVTFCLHPLSFIPGIFVGFREGDNTTTPHFNFLLSYHPYHERIPKISDETDLSVLIYAIHIWTGLAKFSISRFQWRMKMLHILIIC